MYRGSCLVFHSRVLNSFEVSGVLMGHMLNAIHQRYNWGSLEIGCNETVSFLKTFLSKAGIKLSIKIEDMLYIFISTACKL